ncbi:MAG: Cyclic pyranopterin monophosphate synthase accessory protein, partial [uncultured Corynebacteriales bacterium]
GPLAPADAAAVLRWRGDPASDPRRLARRRPDGRRLGQDGDQPHSDRKWKSTHNAPGGGPASAGRPAEGRRARGGPHRRDRRRQTHPGPGPALPPGGAARGGGGPRGRRGRRGDYRHHPHRGPDRRGDGGPDRRRRRRAGADRHGQGGRPRRLHHRHPGRGQERWPLRDLAAWGM